MVKKLDAIKIYVIAESGNTVDFALYGATKDKYNPKISLKRYSKEYFTDQKTGVSDDFIYPIIRIPCESNQCLKRKKSRKSTQFEGGGVS